MDSWDYERDLILRNDADNAEEPTMPNEGPWITKTIIELEERVAELESDEQEMAGDNNV